jgi:NAD(P) transhydrogenase subunit beta
MNVLLGERAVPNWISTRSTASSSTTDVAARRRTSNPSARTDKASPIYGMPILDADKAQHVIIVKRSLNAGFAGVDNPLYYDPRTLMLFGDAKGVISKLLEALKAAA